MTREPRRLVVRPAAEGDIAEAFRWYEERSPGLGEAFTSAVEAALREIERHPELHPRVRGAARRALLRRFPYAVFYVVRPDIIEVLACFHVRRDPRRWIERIS